jgi:hypothetical protein
MVPPQDKPRGCGNGIPQADLKHEDLQMEATTKPLVPTEALPSISSDGSMVGSSSSASVTTKDTPKWSGQVDDPAESSELLNGSDGVAVGTKGLGPDLGEPALVVPLARRQTGGGNSVDNDTNASVTGSKPIPPHMSSTSLAVHTSLLSCFLPARDSGAGALSEVSGC